jgi:acetoacetyl-CoA synthetase
VYGLHTQGIVPIDNPKIEIAALAREYLRHIRSVQPRGPYHLCGECSSGYAAYEIAQLLCGAGEEVALLALIDSPGPWGLLGPWRRLMRRILRFAKHMRDHARNIRKLPFGRRAAYVRGMFRRYKRRILPQSTGPSDEATQSAWIVMAEAMARAREDYRPRPCDGRIVMFITPEFRRRGRTRAALRWRKFACGGFDVHELDCAHSDLLREPNVSVIAAQLRQYLDERR